MLRFKITSEFLAWLDAHDIATTRKATSHRWKPGDVVKYIHGTRLHRHSLFLHGQHIPSFGPFSYSFSLLPENTSVGSYCSIAANVRVMGPQHPTHYTSTSELLYRPQGLFARSLPAMNATEWQPLPANARSDAPVIIRHDVWIGQDCLLKQGIKIGTGAIIGAGAVVTKDVAPYAIMGGVPARFIRWRFPQPLAQRLLASQWWRYAIPLLPHLPWGDPDRLCDALEQAQAAEGLTPYQFDCGTIDQAIKQTAGTAD